jgi:hypothetical protein
MNLPMVPDDFEVPATLETDRFRLRMLTVHDVVKDYDAMISRGEVTAGLTLEQNLIDLGWHQKEFQRRSSFTYTVMSLDESRCLGCVYIYPSRTPGVDADIRMWIRGGEEELDPVLFDAVREWIATRWRFGRVAYPRREG